VAWEDRGNRQYYYRKRRIGNRVVSEYVGAGLRAELTAEEDMLEREHRKRERQEWNELKSEVQALDRELDSVGDLTRCLTRASLLLAGYHPHKGQWRKKRGD
jgi:hypothetical protein